MPSSTPSPRRAAPATSNPRPNSEKTIDLSGVPKTASAKTGAPKTTGPKTAPPKVVDAGSKRRALKKKKARQSGWLAWTVAGAITVAVAGTSAGIWTEFRTVKGRVAKKRATLADLKIQFESGKRRLETLASASGKERVLVENGFIKPGERLLLFPKNKN